MSQKGKERPDWVPLVKKVLQTIFFDHHPNALDLFCQQLKANGAVLAGGFMLRAITGDTFDSTGFTMETNADSHVNTDIDIYVPVQNTRAIIHGLTRTKQPTANNQLIFPTESNERQRIASSNYCRSFLRRNGIRAIHSFVHKKGNIMMDVMSVRKSRSIEDVVTNFDLTICQVWFDGEMVYASHPEHIEKRSGLLQGDYVETLLAGNQFLVSRMHKYKNRGFTIAADHSPTIESMNALENSNSLTIKEKVRRSVWRTIMYVAYFNGFTGFDGNTIEEENKEHIAILPCPLLSSFKHCDTVYQLLGSHHRAPHVEDRDHERLLSEYEDMDSDDEEDQKKVPEPLYRTLLTRMIIWSFTDLEIAPALNDIVFQINLATILRKAKMKEWKTAMIEMLPVGEDAMGDEGPLLFFHNHGEDGQGFTINSLLGYLKDRLSETFSTRMDTPCIAKAFGAADCDQKHEPYEIKPLVSQKFFNKWMVENPIRTGLNQILPLYNAVLYNEKTHDPLGFGDIFGSGMCPFCLQFESRVEGCTYMTHRRIQGESIDKAPYCSKKFAIQELVDWYHDTAHDLVKNDYGGHEPPPLSYALRFCIECGAPSASHEHIGGTLEDPELLPHQAAGICTGGGRRELIARILAVRDVFESKQYTDPMEERKAAAITAIRKCRDPLLLDRADAILAQEKNSRKWNKEINMTPHYPQDPAYGAKNDDAEDSKENEDNEEENNNNGVQGGRRMTLRNGRKLLQNIRAKSHKARRNIFSNV